MKNTERNIVNQEALENTLSTLIEKNESKDPLLAEYVNKNLRNYLYRKAPVASAWRFSYKRNLSPLEQKIKEKGGPYHEVIISHELIQDMSHVLDFLSSHPNLLKDSLDYESALAQSKTWTKVLQKKEIKDSAVVEDIMTFDDNLKMVKLISESAFVLEGQKMHHCVGSYSKKKETDVYSLRTSENNPIVTLSVKNNIIEQYVTQSNQPVPKQFHPHLNIFAQKNGFKFYKINTNNTQGEFTRILPAAISIFITFKWKTMLHWFFAGDQKQLEAILNNQFFSNAITLGLGLLAFLKLFDFFSNFGSGTRTFEVVDQIGDKKAHIELPKENESPKQGDTAAS